MIVRHLSKQIADLAGAHLGQERAELGPEGIELQRRAQQGRRLVVLILFQKDRGGFDQVTDRAACRTPPTRRRLHRQETALETMEQLLVEREAAAAILGQKLTERERAAPRHQLLK